MRAVLVVIVVGSSIASGAAVANHRPTATAHCTYESGADMGQFGMAAEDPVGVTQDGAINKDVCLFEFPDTDPGPPPITDDPREIIRELLRETLTAGAITLDGQYATAQATIVDDVFGTEVGGSVAADFDHNTVFGEEDKGEPSASFCGGVSPVLEANHDTDDNGHDDFGWAVAVFTNGPIDQATNCDPTAAPTATTGGIFNPAGGIYMTVG